jgi:hypothetical protein
MAAFADRLADLLAPWVDAYSSSSVLEISVMFMHLGGLLVGGGLAFAFDRAVLHPFRSAPERREELSREMGMAHRMVLGGLIAMVVSGVALTAADPTVYLVSSVYWVKMGLFAVLLANGWLLERAGRRVSAAPDDDGAFRQLRAAAVRSMALWVLVVLFGVALTMDA